MAPREKPRKYGENVKTPALTRMRTAQSQDKMMEREANLCRNFTVIQANFFPSYALTTLCLWSGWGLRAPTPGWS